MNRVLVVAAAMLAAACNLKPQSEKVVKQDPPFVFPHAPHVEGDVDCLLCHGGIDQATKLDANVRHVKLPAKISKTDECSGCHDTEPKVTVPARHQPFRLSFSHADHVSRVKGNCKACHDPATLPDKGGKEYGYPAMAKCTACHNHQADYNQARCTPCHTDLKGLVPVQTYAHQGDWLRLHGQFAKPVAASCAQCHDQTYCNECHSAQTAPALPSVIYPEEVERAFIHRGDYVSRHFIDARAQPENCRRCHGSGFCDACHQLNGVSDANALRQVHPAGWGNPGSAKFHGDAARRDILQCAGCHDQGPAAICVGCHREGSPITQGLGPNGPHPSAFVSAHRGENKTKGICAACHVNP
jgi:hypothetical protein